MWESPEQVFDRIGAQLELLFFALEAACADASAFCEEQKIDRARFPNTYSDLVRTYAWTRHLDPLVAEGLLRCWSDGNAGIAAFADGTTIRVLHEDDGSLPAAKTTQRQRFYVQPQPTLFEWGDDGEISILDADEWKIRHVVAMWEYHDVRGLELTIVAPNGGPASVLWSQPVPHPLADAQISFGNVVDLDEATDDVDEVQLYTDPSLEEESVDEVANLEEPPEEGGDAQSGGETQ